MTTDHTKLESTIDTLIRDHLELTLIAASDRKSNIFTFLCQPPSQTLNHTKDKLLKFLNNKLINNNDWDTYNNKWISKPRTNNGCKKQNIYSNTV